MDITVLHDIPFTLDNAQLLERLKIPPDSGFDEEVLPLAAQAQAIGRPKAMVKLSRVESKTDHAVAIDGVTLTSRILRVNLDQAERVYPFVATCGTELEEWSQGIYDPLQRYWADSIKEMALHSAFVALDAYLAEHHLPGHVATMNPGSLKDWPIEQQRPLFSILGDPAGAIGVQLTESYLMLPTKSVSGIRFAMESDYANCQLCQREECPNRRAPYDPELFERRYQA
jgi:hypothetical protein